jgi:hypothetical protein
VKDEASGLALTSTRECAQVIDEQTQPRQAEGQTKDAEGGTQDNAGWQMIHQGNLGRATRWISRVFAKAKPADIARRSNAPPNEAGAA